MVEWCDRILIDYIGSTGFIDNAHEVKLAQFGFREREKFIYEYNFCDSWKHQKLFDSASGRGRK